jgi:hypothetical protein
LIPAHISGVVLVGAQDASGVLWGEGDENPYLQFQQGVPQEIIASVVLVFRGDFDVSLAAAQSHISQIPALHQQGNHQRALEEARTAVALVPESARLKAQLGGTLKRLHRDEEAEVAFAEARRLAKIHQPNDQSKQIAELIAELQQPDL